MKSQKQFAFFVSVAALGLLLSAGCTPKAEEAVTAPPATAPAVVPAGANKPGAASQPTRDYGADAAAMRAAREKAEGK